MVYFCLKLVPGVILQRPPFCYDPVHRISEIRVEICWWGPDYFAIQLFAETHSFGPIHSSMVIYFAAPLCLLTGLIISSFLLGMRRSAHLSRI